MLNMDEDKKIKTDDSEIRLKINTYDDIFSDFDPRPYSQRAMSDDFLFEARKASADKESGTITLKFAIPKEKRKWEDEALIKKRLREHFKKHYELLAVEIKKTKNRGILMGIAGILMISLAAFISSLQASSFLMHFIIIVLEPAGWFTSWTGLDQIYYTVNEKRPDLNFYEKMYKSAIFFSSS